MRRIAETMDEENPFYTDFKFFSAINYTTQSEYRQELKKFLKEFVIQNGMFVEEKFIEDLKTLIRNSLFGIVYTFGNNL